MFINQKGCIMIPAAYFAMDKCDAARAIEIAEEDMTEKAVNAFCDFVCSGRLFPCFGNRKSCKMFNEFKQKMME